MIAAGATVALTQLHQAAYSARKADHAQQDSQASEATVHVAAVMNTDVFGLVERILVLQKHKSDEIKLLQQV